MAQEKQKTEFMPKDKRVTLVIIVVIFITAIGAGAYYLGYKHGENKTKAEYQEVLESYSELIPGLISSNDKIMTINGKVVKTENNTVYLEANKLTNDLLELNTKMTYEIALTDATKIYPAEKIDLLTLFNPDALGESKKRETLSVSDLKEGNEVRVDATENILGNNKFTAATITLLSNSSEDDNTKE